MPGETQGPIVSEWGQTFVELGCEPTPGELATELAMPIPETPNAALKSAIISAATKRNAFA
jgi:hypothetical protein